MSSKQLFTLLLLLLLVFSYNTVPAEENFKTTTVKVIGTGLFDDDNNMAKARGEAVADGLVTAVELVAVDIMPISSFAENYPALNKFFNTYVDQFINGYKVLTELRFKNEYRIIIQATVSIARVKQGLETAGIIYLPLIEENNLKVPEEIKITVNGTSNLVRFVLFRKELQKFDGLSALQLEQMEFDKAVIAVTFTGDAKALAHALISKTFDSFSVNIIEISEHCLNVNLAHVRNLIPE